MGHPHPSAATLSDLTSPSNGTSTSWSAGEFASHELLQALPVAVYTTDAAGRITFYNEAAVTLWGCRPELGKSEICGSWRLYWPDGRPMQHDECPMAIAIKEQRPISGAEAVAERPDGVRVPFLAYPRPLFDEAGRLAGAVNMLVDITDRKKAENAAQRLSAIVESSDDAIVSKDLEGTIVTWNPGAERLFGYTAEEAIGEPVTMLIPTDHLDEEPEILARIRRGERIDHYETIRRRKDGSLVDISLTVSPIKDSDGRVIGASKIARGITERRQHQEQQRLLFREMNHRIRNLFTLAGTIVSLSTRFAATPEELADAVNARLVALGRAHDLTLPDIAGGAKNFDQATTLPDLAHTILAPYRTDGSLTIDGPDVPVSGKPAMSIALLLHELATNAAKYGALTSKSGRIELIWRMSEDELALTWRERGGPPVAGRPETEGFGSLLARRTATGQLNGKIFHDWNEEGLTVNLSAPVGGLVE
jgi:PAS domain S-box-containing protein